MEETYKVFYTVYWIVFYTVYCIVFYTVYCLVHYTNLYYCVLTFSNMSTLGGT